MKKLASLLLALVMLISCVPAMAEEAETYTIIIENQTPGHKYEAYQIFTGTLYDEDTTQDNPADTVLSDVQWGTGISYNGAGVNIGTDEEPNISTEASAIAKALSNGTLTLDALLADLQFDAPFATATEHIADTTTHYSISGLPAGYYLVKDREGSINGTNDAYTEFIIEVVENSTVKPKSSVPSVEKKVEDTNDSTGETTGWQDSADHDVNDDVPFQLTATLASNVESYNTYKIVFHDTLSAGLTYNADSIHVYLNSVSEANEVDATNYTVTHVNGKLTISFENVKAFGATNNSKIIVEYTAKLNENAVIGAEGNPNEVYLEYSNNPNWVPGANDGIDNDNDGEIDEEDEENEEPTGETPVDTVIVFTYTFDVNKVTADGTALAGAKFSLYKYDADAEGDDKWVKLAEPTENPASDTDENVVAGSVFTWDRIDDGFYKLVEDQAPAGYNMLAEPIYFKVTATHDVEAVNPALNSLAVTVTDENGEPLTGENIPGFTTEYTQGTIDTDVVNMPGSTLPETGGMGTTILYVGGGILVLAAIVLLIVKRRANAE